MVSFFFSRPLKNLTFIIFLNPWNQQHHQTHHADDDYDDVGDDDFDDNFDDYRDDYDNYDDDYDISVGVWITKVVAVIFKQHALFSFVKIFFGSEIFFWF